MIRDEQFLGQTHFFLNFVYCVHMPVFFFWGGYFALSSLKQSFHVFCGKKVVRLVIPYVMWSCVAVAAKEAVAFLNGTWDLGQCFLLICSTLLEAESMWFLIALFWMQLLFWAMYRLFPFGLGMLVYKKKDIISAFAQDHKLLWVPAGIVLLTTPLYVSFVYVHRLGYGLPFVISGLVEVIVSTAFCYLCKYILHWVVGLRKFFMVLGKYSLEIYCIHMMFVKYLSIKVPTVVFNIPVVVDFLYCLIALLIALLCGDILFGLESNPGLSLDYVRTVETK